VERFTPTPERVEHRLPQLGCPHHVEIADRTHAVYGNDGIDFGLPATTNAPTSPTPATG
jgi:hypothetical protein